MPRESKRQGPCAALSPRSMRPTAAPMFRSRRRRNRRRARAVAKQAAALPTIFVAPPRTITDITAILDSEKPDPATRSRNCAPRPMRAGPGQSARARNSRVSITSAGRRARNLANCTDAIADADKALETARGAVDPNLLGRLEQFAAQCNIRLAGDPKQALEIFQQQLRDTNYQGRQGYLFGAYRQISQDPDQDGRPGAGGSLSAAQSQAHPGSAHQRHARLAHELRRARSVLGGRRRTPPRRHFRGARPISRRPKNPTGWRSSAAAPPSRVS